TNRIAAGYFLRPKYPSRQPQLPGGDFTYDPVTVTLLSLRLFCVTLELFEIEEVIEAEIAEATALILMLKGLPPATASSSLSVSSISSYIANVLSMFASTSAIGLAPKQRLAIS